ncbi:MAG: HD domain-containing protein [Treponema sp.]|nr:HD domain-containing protein [Spirochaetales bacterium]MDY6189266.1 HD domain-containing protein [Treponema sp.]
MINFANNLILDFEKDSDLRISGICRAITGLILIVIVLNVFNVFNISSALYPTLIAASVILMIPTLFFEVLKKRSKKIRYMVLTLLVIMSGLMYSILSYHVIIMLVFPVVVSCLYCERANVIYTTVLSIPVMIISHLIAYSLKIVPDEPLVTLRGVLIYGILPRVIELVAISLICIGITGKLQRLITALVKKNNELYEEQQIIVGSLSELVETQSHETGQHVKRVAAYTEILCRAMGLSEEETWKISVASMMHDVGKICVPREILHKPGKLTEEEFSEIKKHVDYGHKLLENSSGEIMRLAANIAWQHHERYDGKGYENELSGENINIYARAVAVADVFDALVSKRCYKKSWTPTQAREEILNQSGRQFDPQITKLFDEHFDEFLKVMEDYPDAS